MKRAARLTSALLAKKGFALPAAASIIHMDSAAAAAVEPHLSEPVLPEDNVAIEDAAGSSSNTVKTLESRLEKAFGAAPAGEPRATGFGRRRVPAGDTGRRVAMTLRLDGDRHLKLRVMSAHSHLSSQQILTKALDEYLQQHCKDHGLKRCECLQSSAGCA